MTVKDFISGWISHTQGYWNQQSRNRKLYGKLQHAPSEIYQLVHDDYAPCFVLSTGRCGTQLLTTLFEQHSKVDAYHEPAPELVYFGKYAYEHQEQHKELSLAVDASRYELIRDAFLLDLIYVETNNRITFFAHQLATLFPKARFIHLIRKPEAFVKSGLGRSWYSGEKIQDEGRITPLDASTQAKWPGWNQTQKIAWLWNATNQFIEDFKQTQPAGRCLTVLAENLFKDPEETNRITDFVGVDRFAATVIQKAISQPVNKGRSDSKLSEDQIGEIRHLTSLAAKYYN